MTPLIVLVLWLAGCHLQPRLIAVEPLPAYDAAFDRSSGWVGGDGAFSAALGQGRILWLFGDTFVGRVDDGRRRAVLVPNSLAVQHGPAPREGILEFFYGNMGEGKPGAAFRPEAGEGAWFWPYHAVRTRAGLFVFLLRVERTDASVFGFRLTDVWLGRIADPDVPPSGWRVELQRVPWADGRRVFGSGVLSVEDECYVFGTVEAAGAEGSRKHAIVARAPADRLWDFTEWRFYDGSGWVPDVDRAAPVCADVAPELSVAWLQGIGRYVMVHSATGLSPEMVVRYAAAPEGPWGPPETFYRCSEAARDPRIFCYAAKGHPAVAPEPGALVVTYVANATDFALVAEDASLYRPRFLRLRFGAGLFSLP